MIRFRSVFATTALAGALSLIPVLAPTGLTSMASAATTAIAASDQGWVAEPGAQWRATRLTGLDVYNRQNEKLGSISDLLVDRQGRIGTVVLSVGGFLGIGDRLVAVPFDRLAFAFKTKDGGYVGVDGQPIAMTDASGNTAGREAARTGAARADAADAASSQNGGVGAAVDNAGNAVADAGRAVGHAAVAVGSAAVEGVSNAVNSIGDNGVTPDRVILDATKEQLLQAPEFGYVKKS